jgi:hypothetical protein
MAERMEERHESSNKPGNLDCFLHSFRIQEGAFDELLQRVEIPSRVILGEHDLPGAE